MSTQILSFLSVFHKKLEYLDFKAMEIWRRRRRKICVYWSLKIVIWAPQAPEQNVFLRRRRQQIDVLAPQAPKILRFQTSPPDGSR